MYLFKHLLLLGLWISCMMRFISHHQIVKLENEHVTKTYLPGLCIRVVICSA